MWCLTVVGRCAFFGFEERQGFMVQLHPSPPGRYRGQHVAVPSLVLSIAATALLLSLLLLVGRVSERMAEQAPTTLRTEVVLPPQPRPTLSPERVQRPLPERAAAGEAARMPDPAAAPAPSFIAPPPRIEIAPRPLPVAPLPIPMDPLADGTGSAGESATGQAAGNGSVGTGSGTGAGSGSDAGTRRRPAIVPASERRILRWAPNMVFRRLDAYYPPAARQARQPGIVELDCLIERRDRVSDCRVVSESPAGHGFGAAAVRAQEVYRVQLRNGNQERIYGERFTITARFIPRR